MGQKQAMILISEAKKVENINSAVGDSEAAILLASGQSKAIDLISNSLRKEHGKSSASLSIAREYVSAFAGLAKHSNTLILPSDPSNIANMVSQAMSIFYKVSNNSYLMTNPDITESQRPSKTNFDLKLDDTSEMVDKSNFSGGNMNDMSVFNSATRVEGTSKSEFK